MGSCQAKDLAALFLYIEKTALENVEWLLYYTVPACESKKFSAYVGKTLIQSAAVFIFVVQSFIRDGICLKSKAPNRKQSEPSHFRVTFSTNSVQKKKRDSS